MLAECKAFEEQRGRLTATIGRNLSPAAIVSALLAGDTKREAVTSFCEEVIGIKEVAERNRGHLDLDRTRRMRGRPLNSRQHNQRR